MKTMALHALAATALLASAYAHAADMSESVLSRFEADAEEVCEHENTRRGVLDSSGYRYCMRGQIESIGEIEHINAQQAGEYHYETISYPYCERRASPRGTTDPGRLSYCLRLELEAYRDVLYYAETYGMETVGPILRDAIERFGNLDMAAYRIKRVVEPSP